MYPILPLFPFSFFPFPGPFAWVPPPSPISQDARISHGSQDARVSHGSPDARAELRAANRLARARTRARQYRAKTMSQHHGPPPSPSAFEFSGNAPAFQPGSPTPSPTIPTAPRAARLAVKPSPLAQVQNTSSVKTLSSVASKNDDAQRPPNLPERATENATEQQESLPYTDIAFGEHNVRVMRHQRRQSQFNSSDESRSTTPLFQNKQSAGQERVSPSNSEEFPPLPSQHQMKENQNQFSRPPIPTSRVWASSKYEELRAANRDTSVAQRQRASSHRVISREYEQFIGFTNSERVAKLGIHKKNFPQTPNEFLEYKTEFHDASVRGARLAQEAAEQKHIRQRLAIPRPIAFCGRMTAGHGNFRPLCNDSLGSVTSQPTAFADLQTSKDRQPDMQRWPGIEELRHDGEGMRSATGRRFLPLPRRWTETMRSDMKYHELAEHAPYLSRLALESFLDNRQMALGRPPGLYVSEDTDASLWHASKEEETSMLSKDLIDAMNAPWAAYPEKSARE